MIHLHRAITLFVVCLCVPHFLVAQSNQKLDSALCYTYFDSAKSYFYRYDAIDSLRYFGVRLIDVSEKVGHDSLYLEGISIVGVSYLRENDYQNALQFFEKNRSEAIRLKDETVEAHSLINLGNVYVAVDSNTKAMQVLMDCAKLLEQRKDSAMLTYVYTSLGIIMGKIYNRPEQLKFSRKAFQVGGGEIVDKKTLTLACNLAVNYLNSNIVDSAETLGLKVLEKSREFGNLKTQTQILTHLANISNKRGKDSGDLSYFRKTIGYANEVIQYEETIKHSHTFCNIYTYQGQAYIFLDKPQKAITSLLKALEYAEKEQSQQLTRHVYSQLHLAYALAGNFEKAYNAMVLFKDVSDTLSSEQNVRILNDLETKYQTEKKEQQLRELSQMNEIAELKLKQRNIWIIVLIVLALLIAGSVYFVSRQRLLKHQQEALENRLLSLRVQLNPHFIFNALTAVQNYMLGGKDLREAVRYLSNFAKVMRAFLEYNQEEKITLDKELNALELYVGIQKLRFNNGFDFDVEVNDGLDPEEVQVPPMILQPLIENAIEHGIRNLDNGKITLKYELEDGSLVMRLSDNGVGRKKAAETGVKSTDKTSLATRITEERIALLNRKAEGKYSLEIRDLEEDGTGTEVIFKIPFAES